MVEPHIKNSQM